LAALFFCLSLEGTMNLVDLYTQVRWTHISLVLVSGALFAARGIGVLLGAGWSMAPVVRRLSYTIDTALLVAALLLLFMLNINPFAVSWLSTKIALLLLYIVMGTLALKRARTLRMQQLCFVAALATYGFMLSVALAHHPFGIFAALQSVRP
jgi:uncharacterized membrane protein SirB2